MKIQICAGKQSPPLAALLTAEFVKSDIQVDVEWQNGAESFARLSPDAAVSGESSICRLLARLAPQRMLFGCQPLEQAQIDHWLTATNIDISKLDELLARSTYLLPASHPTIADFCVLAQLIRRPVEAGTNIQRWWDHLFTMKKISDCVASVEKIAPIKEKSPDKEKNTAKLDRGKFVDLPGAEMGKVVVRFPPEASGYLHIGHAKAALLNQHYQLAFNGKLVLRFDDTNPDKEKEDFEHVILEDVAMLGIKPDIYTFTSDSFPLIQDMCERLLRQGDAYVDDTDAETMKKEREARQESKHRNNSVKKNLQMWEEMVKGTDYGLMCCVRAKIDMNSNNGCMRDPTIYRCKIAAHPRQGNRYKVYPTYDFACPIVDSIEGITHALRTTEYHDRDEQFYWVINKLGLRKPFIYEYARLNLMNTVLSKRKLTFFVDQGVVTGWDDPRMPTVRGILRRGLTVEGLKEFILAQGSSKSVVIMEWDKLWAFNKKRIEASSKRFYAVEADGMVEVHIDGLDKSDIEIAWHPKDPDMGTKKLVVDRVLLVDKADAEQMKAEDTVTFMSIGNVKITEALRNGQIKAKADLENKDFKKTLKVSWIAKAAANVRLAVYYMDNIISKPVLSPDDDFKKYIRKVSMVDVSMLGESNMSSIKKGDIIQIQRKGFFICDSIGDSNAEANTDPQPPMTLIYVPDGGKNLAALPSKARDLYEGKLEKSEHLSHLAGQAKPAVISANVTDENGTFLWDAVAAQGDKVRQMKAEKADKLAVTSEVKVLLALKEKYKAATGVNWDPKNKPETAASTGPLPASVATFEETNDTLKLWESVEVLEGKVRDMKLFKDASNDAIKAEIDVLLKLKKDFKAITGVEWSRDQRPQSAPSPPANTSETGVSNNGVDIGKQIKDQGDKIRQLKAAKAAKEIITSEVNLLLDLKEKFKKATGAEWSPNVVVTMALASTEQPSKADNLSSKIVTQGDKVRQLKAAKAAKDVVQAEVEILLSLKAAYKDLTGAEWKSPSVNSQISTPAATQTPSATAGNISKGDSIENKIKLQAAGEAIGSPKITKASMQNLQPEVGQLLELKEKSKEKTGGDYVAVGKAAQGSSGKPSGSKPEKQQALQTQANKMEDGSKKRTRLGLEARKEENLSDWYSQIITKSEMIEYYDVSGCYVLRPMAYGIWQRIQEFFDAKIKEIGVENCYFPMFVSSKALEREKSHIADFSPEVAWVTKSGSSDLIEPIAIRPTSETVMYPSYAKWIKSHRDLPLKLNQWCNVVRWEFKNPQPFLRTREFLWQEGHTAFSNSTDAMEEVHQILGFYTEVYEKLLAIPVIRGKKTEKEKFAGGFLTTTVEAFVPASGRGIQGATSHHLGQNFSKIFDIVYEDPDTREKRYVYQNSWGITTRTIGVMVMVHGDNKGLVVPPRVSQYQAVVIPCGITASLSEADAKKITDRCQELTDELQKRGVRVHLDSRENYSPGWKFNHWELKGVPIRIEIGPKDVANAQFVAVRRDKSTKCTLKTADEIIQLLDTIQSDMFTNAKKEMDGRIKQVYNMDDFVKFLEAKCLLCTPFCETEACEDEIKKMSTREEVEPGTPAMGAKSLCIPFEQPMEITDRDKCVRSDCPNKPKSYTIFGRSY
ncbi:bifunctional glutamate/proline--tRNA ligase-like [Varroa jacobsoni]|uniref:bifunctional glutamate/proline--tRNA ligase-like n=1 Tax=Varroa jacobsoni TaxID=62625 RepID=UPI000BF67D5D|nr:bifunctional glutamate/proline--tRNA ligase-like [Varroa jacobsoni]